MISRYGIFCKIIETGSFTKTAELLGYSQSAVSQTIKALEQETGTTLINRRKDGTLLTVDGAAYLPYFQQIYQAEEALERKEREMRGLENSVIQIGTFTSVSRNLLPELMREFKKSTRVRALCCSRGSTRILQAGCGMEALTLAS